MPAPTCLLFFPGSTPELLPKALASGARLVCADLEDAVPPDAKDAARRAVLALVASHAEGPRLAVRINRPGTEHGRADIAALAGLASLPAPLTVLAPKVDGPADLAPLHDAFGEPDRSFDVIPVIETAAGLASVESIAAANRVTALLFGGLDLSTELHCALDWEPLLYARSRCVHAARLAGVALFDTPFFDVRDPDGLRSEAERVRRLGFDGKAAIHPGQVSIIHEAFTPDGTAVDRARRIVEASEGAGGGVLLVDGIMIDRPAVEAARRIVATSRQEER